MKKCFKCGEIKHLNEFYAHSQMKDGRLNKCKDCAKKDTKENVLSNKEYYKEYDRNRAMRPDRVEARRLYALNNPDKLRAYKKKYRELNNDKYKAVSLVNNKKRSGEIKEHVCLMCGDPKVQAHHEDYSQPLNVIWLCAKHHSELHKKRRWNKF